MKNITKDTFKKEVLESNKVVLVDVWAPWCAPCKGIAPVIEQISDEMKDIQVFKINISEETELAQQLNISGLPTFLVFKNGNIVDTLIGARPKSSLTDMIKKHL